MMIKKSLQILGFLFCLFLGLTTSYGQNDKLEVNKKEKKLIEELTYEMQPGLPLAASKIYFTDSKFAISGFGEVGHTNYRGPKDRTSGDIELFMTDLYRFVTYVAYKPKPWLVLYGEIFAELYRDAQIRETDYEFFLEVFADFLLHKNFNVRAGTAQVQIGYVNNNDEPIQFFTVNRSEVERLIIPSQWIDLGIMTYGDLTDKLKWSLSIYQGLNTRDLNGGTWIRRGRDHAFRHNFNGYILNGSLEYSIDPHTTWAINGVWTRAGNNQEYTLAGDNVRISANTSLVASYVRREMKNFTLMALGTYGRMDETDQLFQLTQKYGMQGTGAGQVLGSEVYGYYIEAGYDILPLLKKPGSKTSKNGFIVKSGEMKLPVFFRYDRLNTHSQVHPSLQEETFYRTDLHALSVGVNFNPRRNIVLKSNYQFRRNAEPLPGTQEFEGNRFEVGMGFIF
ncbi:MAG: hypothetical protein JJU28_07295 [Cyclobacteriaceae bacterium]|nr:hypothetical protein [Cyclobacteriaceae bacterium]